jgi:hypothetical protein
MHSRNGRIGKGEPISPPKRQPTPEDWNRFLGNLPVRPEKALR